MASTTAGKHEEQATMGQVRRLIRRMIKKHPEHEETSLNIYPMMDMMTILLVFMIMQFSAESPNVAESAELRLPRSTNTSTWEQALTVKILRDSVSVDDRPVIQLRNGTVDPGQKQGGSNGFLILPMHQIMQQYREQARRREQLASGRADARFRGDVVIIADARTPYRTLIEVVYTCGQSEFSNVRFVAANGAAEQQANQAGQGVGQ